MLTFISTSDCSLSLYPAFPPFPFYFMHTLTHGIYSLLQRKRSNAHSLPSLSRSLIFHHFLPLIRSLTLCFPSQPSFIFHASLSLSLSPSDSVRSLSLPTLHLLHLTLSFCFLLNDSISIQAKRACRVFLRVFPPSASRPQVKYKHLLPVSVHSFINTHSCHHHQGLIR